MRLQHAPPTGGVLMTTFLKNWTATTTMLDRNSFDQLPAASRHALALVCKGCQPVADYEAAWHARGDGNHAKASARAHFRGRALLGMPAAARVKRHGRALLKQAVKQHQSCVLVNSSMVVHSRYAQVEGNRRPAGGRVCRPAQSTGGEQRQQPLHGVHGWMHALTALIALTGSLTQHVTACRGHPGVQRAHAGVCWVARHHCRVCTAPAGDRPSWQPHHHRAMGPHRSVVRDT